MDLEKPVIPPPFSESESVTHQSKKDELYAAFIGKKYQSYYQEKFQNLEALKPKGGFNIAAFLIGPIWLFYRKMYAYGFIYIAFMIIYGIFADFVEISDSTDRAISIAVAVTLGLSGNGLYKNFVDILDEMAITKNERYGITDIKAWETAIYDKKVGGSSTAEPTK